MAVKMTLEEFKDILEEANLVVDDYESALNIFALYEYYRYEEYKHAGYSEEAQNALNSFRVIHNSLDNRGYYSRLKSDYVYEED